MSSEPHSGERPQAGGLTSPHLRHPPPTALGSNRHDRFGPGEHSRNVMVPPGGYMTLCACGHDDGTIAIAPWAWCSRACRTEPGPCRAEWLACLPMTTRSALADKSASARPG